MDNGPKIAIGVTAVFVLAIGVRVGLIYKANHEEVKEPDQPTYARKLNDDDVVYLKKEHPSSLKDERELIGHTLWISAANQMDYYVDKGKHVDYSKPVGVLLGAEPVVIEEVFEEKAPAGGRAVSRIGPGLRQVLLGFTKPASSDPKAMYAVPVGNFDDGYNFFTDEIFFYDDPHQLYKHWGTEMWQHIDKHEAVLGMSENQAMLSLGQVLEPHGGTTGDRSVTYDNNGKPITIVFEKDKATKITPGS